MPCPLDVWYAATGVKVEAGSIQSFYIFSNNDHAAVGYRLVVQPSIPSFPQCDIILAPDLRHWHARVIVTRSRPSNDPIKKARSMTAMTPCWTPPELLSLL
eukprot:3940587-Rhodomonas_salina.5